MKPEGESGNYTGLLGLGMTEGGKLTAMIQKRCNRDLLRVVPILATLVI